MTSTNVSETPALPDPSTQTCVVGILVSVAQIEEKGSDQGKIAIQPTHLAPLYTTSSTLLPIVGCVTTTSPRFSLYSLPRHFSDQTLGRRVEPAQEWTRLWIDDICRGVIRKVLQGTK